MNQKKIIITGASSGVGEATARLLAAKGAHVFLIARGQEKLDHIVAEIIDAGGKASAYAADLADYSQVQAAFEAADEQLGELDGLVNAAGLPGKSIFTETPEYLQQIIAVNLIAGMYCAKEAAKRMQVRQSGHIINIGSLCIRVLDKGADIYVASKTGIAGFTAALRKELADSSVAVTLLNPGAIASGMVSETEAEKKRAVEEFRMLEPHDVAEAILYVLSQPERVAVTELEVVPRKQLVF